MHIGIGRSWAGPAAKLCELAMKEWFAMVHVNPMLVWQPHSVLVAKVLSIGVCEGC